MLRNTAWMWGVAVFTGPQSKVMLNSTAARSKRSTLERRLDRLIIGMFCLLAAMCVTDAVGAALWVDTAQWYLDLGNPEEPAATRALFDPAARPLVGALDFLTALTLYSTLIPISLYVSIEIIKYFQASPCSAYALLPRDHLLPSCCQSLERPW